VKNKENTFEQDFLSLQKDIYEAAIKTDSESKGGKFRFKYLSLPGLLEAVVPICHKHNCSLRQDFEILKTGDAICEIMVIELRHKSGETINSKVIIDQNWSDIKEWGSCTTYKARYAIMRLLGIHQDSDDSEDRQVKKPNFNSNQRNYKSTSNESPYITSEQYDLICDALRDDPEYAAELKEKLKLSSFRYMKKEDFLRANRRINEILTIRREINKK